MRNLENFRKCAEIGRLQRFFRKFVRKRSLSTILEFWLPVISRKAWERKKRNRWSFAFSRIKRRTCRIQIFRTRRAAKSYFNNHFKVTRTPRRIMHPRRLVHLLRWHTWTAWWPHTIRTFWPNWKWRSVEKKKFLLLLLLPLLLL